MQKTTIGDAMLILGDCLDVLKTLSDSSVDSIVTDPPYELGFMGKAWDSTGIANNVAMWTECLRVLKPGGHLLAFAGTRTYHRMTCAIEDAGFEIRDQIQWLYGSGFPKSHNLEGDWEGWGTALKPANEPICMARKPLIGTVAQNMDEFSTGALNINECRIPTDEELRAGAGRTWAVMHKHEGRTSREGEASADRRYQHNGGTNFAMKPGPRGGDSLGRWPANVIHDGSDEVIAEFAKYGTDKGAFAPVRGTEPTSNGFSGAVSFSGLRDRVCQADTFRGDTGSAARFYYCAKASREDRNEGCEAFAKKPLNWSSGTQNPGSFQSEGTDKTAQNYHPTVKPTELMRYLCRLVTPPGGTVLDVFMGSGSTGKAAVLEGFKFIGIELDQDYVSIAEARIRYADAQPFQERLFA